MPTQTHPRSRIAGELFELATRMVGSAEASRFLFCGNAGLGGSTPIQALTAGYDDDVKRAILKLARQEPRND